MLQKVYDRVRADKKFFEKLLDGAPKDAVPRIVRPVAGHIARTLSTEFKRADLDGDHKLSLKELRTWYSQRYPSFSSQREFTMSGSVVAGMTSKSKGGEVLAPTRRQLGLVAAAAGIPFIGFGFLDNFIMLIAGNQIEMSLGATLGLSSLAAAGLGNMVSDVAGMKAGGVIEALAEKMGLPRPGLSPQQLALPIVKRTTLFSGSLGIAFGCLLGMIPLLFIDGDAHRLREIFDELDESGDGKISASELRRGLDSYGIQLKDSEVRAIIADADADHDGTLSFSEFKEFVETIERRLKKSKATSK